MASAQYDSMKLEIDGVRYLPGLLSRATQEMLLDQIRAVTTAAPLFVPRMPRTGKEMSVRMTNCSRT